MPENFMPEELRVFGLRNERVLAPPPDNWDYRPHNDSPSYKTSISDINESLTTVTDPSR